MEDVVEEIEQKRWKRSLTKTKRSRSSSKSSSCLINNLDDGCLMHIFSFLSPIPDFCGASLRREIPRKNWRMPLDAALHTVFLVKGERIVRSAFTARLLKASDRYNTALVCHRWLYLACHPRLWLRVDRSAKDLLEPGVFPNLETAVEAARPGDTILISAGGRHLAYNIQIKKRLCLIGAGEQPDETTIYCSRGSDSALELLSTCKLANLTVKAELGCCLLHRSGRVTIEGCVLQCETNPLDHLSCPIVSTASAQTVISSPVKCSNDGVSVFRTRIEGGAKAVLTSGDLTLQRVRVIYARTSIFFWFDVEHQ